MRISDWSADVCSSDLRAPIREARFDRRRATVMADPKTPAELADADYAALADFRHALRRFQAFSEAQAAEQGLPPQQHPALLAIRGAAPATPSAGDIAERLMLKQIGRASGRERVGPAG